MNAFVSSMRTRILVAVLVVLGIAVAGTAGWLFLGRDWMQARQEARLDEALRNDARVAETYAAIRERNTQIAERGEDVELLLSLGNLWKAVGDVTADVRHYNRAIEAYERGVAASDGKNSLLLQNLATALRLAKRPEDAERVLRQAIEVNPGDPQLYILLVEVLHTDLQRESKDIIDVYRLGLDRLVDNAPLVQSLAMYLESLGRLKEALVYYQLLATKHPGFEEKIASLKRQIEAQP
ncbi:tetratricopeptide repeat protein [Patescibacteria group bacterium]|nr:MAG: tetratricopeptide repeat protein [Patescibacteria group bacterium]